MGAYPSAGEMFGRYEIVRRVGRGGMSSVFEARQADLDRSVALKVLSPELSHEPEFRLRFAREARMLAALDSPHVIQVHEYGDQDGQLYIAMQLVTGRDLGQLIEDRGPLEPRVALEVVAQVATGLVDAHAAGLLHRDVKPGNVLVRETRGELFAYLCDFGIARPADSGHTRTVGVLGTLGYMAPERHNGAEASAASDVYALGCVLWAALTGRSPYAGTSDIQVALAHMNQPVPEYDGDPTARGDINAIIARSMAKDPTQRYQSAMRMRTALREAQAASTSPHDEQTQASASPTGAPTAGWGVAPTRLRGTVRVPVAGRTAQRPSRRRRRPVVAGVSAALLAGAAVAVVLSGARDDDRSAVPEPAERSSAAVTTTGVSVSTTQRGAASSRASTDNPSSPTARRTPDTSAAEVAARPRPVCWSGVSVRSAAQCPLPSGRKGVASVFPSMDSRCERPSYVQNPDKLDVFECFYGTYMVRYSAWRPSVDRIRYFEVANAGAERRAWVVEGEAAGRQWTSYENDPTESKPFQWSATYAGRPYSVSVEGVSDQARSTGERRVLAKPPSLVGLL